jgi:valyl-tRNA synthetase
MKDEIAKQYNPKETEDKWYRFWEENNLFAAKPNPAKKPFCIVIPPPNVTGILHMGHALNNTIQDILVRYHRMKGEESLWMPGTDHAGIATQNVVEKSLAKEGLKRQDLGRDKFIEKVWLWREQYGSTIIKQLKKLGASCDWQRSRFTMDSEYSQAVIEVFVRLYEKGLIYRGNYIINWCPRCQTALSDEEAPHKELEGNLYYLRYPLKEEIPNSKFPDYVVVATTRPETMLGDTAVAVNPKDKRYKKLIGKTLILPLVNREIKIIADSMVDLEFGTGCVKVTPAHDPNDYILGKKHNLEFVNVMHPDGRMNEYAGDYQDMDRFEAREAILEDLKEKGLLEKVQPHQLSVGHCYRCHTIIEPYLSKQWFVKMKPLAQPAIEAVKKGKIKFYPQRWRKVYLNWMQNIQDWCISRQIWWGHRIPVYYCKKCQEAGILDAKLKEGIIVSRVKPEKCPACGSVDIYQDEDVLDTWFSSWLWPFATFYWPAQAQSAERRAQSERDLSYFYPTSVLVTAAEIIFFWVARMIMAGLEFMKEVPFKDVYIHGTVRDIEGKKMSKSLGNIIDPLEIINEYGADALRFSIISITTVGQDVFLSQEKFEMGRNFANKIWNASRFVMMNLEPDKINVDLCVFFKKDDIDIAQRWILSRFYSNLKQVNRLLDSHKFNEAAALLYAFFWHEFCDWYLEMAKLRIRDPSTQVVMYKLLEKSLRLLHPFMPFITEEIWQRLPHEGSSIMTVPWPHTQEELVDKNTEADMEVVCNIITAIRNLRTEVEVPADKRINVVLFTTEKKSLKVLSLTVDYIKQLAKLENLDLESKPVSLKSAVSELVNNVHIFIPLEGVLDLEKERLKVHAQLEKINAEIIAKGKLLKNKEFIKKAPQDIIAGSRKRLEELKEAQKKLEKIDSELR